MFDTPFGWRRGGDMAVNDFLPECQWRGDHRLIVTWCVNGQVRKTLAVPKAYPPFELRKILLAFHKAVWVDFKECEYDERRAVIFGERAIANTVRKAIGRAA